MRTILIIDDDPRIIKFVYAILPKSKYALESASSVQEALSYLEKKLPHAILLDLKMGQESGFDLLEKPEISDLLAQIPVLMLTGDNNPSSVVRAKKLKITAYILKPITPITLLEKLKKALDTMPPIEYSFMGENQNKALLTLDCEIVHTNEVGMLVESRVKLEQNSEISIHSKFLEDLGAENACFRRSKNSAHLLANHKFINEISIVGLPPENISAIKKAME